MTDTGLYEHHGPRDPILMRPIGQVRSPRTAPLDDDWDTITAMICLDPGRFEEDSLKGLDSFSHVEVVYVFDQVDEQAVTTSSRQAGLAQGGGLRTARQGPTEPDRRLCV